MKPFEYNAVTPRDWKCFFGYYDKSALDTNDKYLLFHRVEFQDRAPEEDDKALIGLIELKTGKTEIIAETFAWNFQQGAMLQWLSADEILYNVREKDAFRAEILDMNSGKKRLVSRPVSALSPDGEHALSLNFSRLARHRPGYGYEGVPDEFEEEKWPGEDGLYLVNLSSGESRMLFSLESMLFFRKEDDASERFAWLNHTLFSPCGKKFVFLNRWQKEPSGWRTRLFVSDLGGNNVVDLLDAYFISHFDWKNDRELNVWAEIDEKKGFWLVDVETREYRFADENLQVEDGHQSYSGDERFILLDTYPDENSFRKLRVFDAVNSRPLELGQFYSPPEITGPFRCDLHPRWSFSEKYISFDSVHEGCRRVYLAETGDVPRLFR